MQHTDKTSDRGDFDSKSSSTENHLENKIYEDEKEERGNRLSGAWGLFLMPYHSVWRNFVLCLGLLSCYFAILSLGFYTRQKTVYFVPLESEELSLIINVCYIFNSILLIGGIFNSDIQARTSNMDIQMPIWLVIPDLISLLPLEYLPGLFPLPDATKTMLYYIANLIECLKLVRIIYILQGCNNRLAYNRVPYFMFEYYVVTSLMVLIGTALSRLIICYRADCEPTKTLYEYVESIMSTFSKFTGSGRFDYSNLIASIICLNILCLVFLMGVTCVSSLIIIDSITSYYISHTFVKKLNDVYKAFLILKISQTTTYRCLSYYQSLWNMRKGFENTTKLLPTFPPIMQQQMSLDINWVAFKHSALFRSMDFPFLFHLSTYVKLTFLNAGDVLFQKGMDKNCMVYINSGIVQIMSEEDGESPILSFSAGTCLSEIGLLLCCRPNTVVRCKSFCAFQILNRADFFRSRRKFANQYKEILMTFDNRIRKAKMYNRKNVNFNTELGETKEQMTMMWLKSTLHGLMANKSVLSDKHQCHNVFLRREFNPKRFISKTFCYQNLDMLAISERLALITDTVFVKQTYPCILQPNSLVLQVWNGIIMILTFYLSIVTPYFAFVEHRTPLYYLVSINVITIFWWFDLYVQTSTAIKTEEGIIATSGGILSARLVTFPFLIDIVSALPIEAIATVFVYASSDQHKAILQLNRIIKVWKIVAVLQKWECSIQSSTILLRYIRYSYIMIYAIFFSACALFARNCFGGTCIHKLSDSTYKQFIWEVLTACHIIVGSNLGLVHSGIKEFFYLTSILTILGVCFRVCVNGKLWATYALSEHDTTATIQHFKEVVDTLKTNNIDVLFIERVINIYEARSSDIFHKSNVFSEMPYHLLELLKEEIYKDDYQKCEFFQNLPEDMLIQVAVLIGDSILLPPNEMVCYSGEKVHAFYIISKGYCKIASAYGVNDTILVPGNTISLLESLLEQNALHTVVTITHCKLLVVARHRLKRLYAEFVLYNKEVNKALEKAKTSTGIKPLYRNVARHVVYNLPKKYIKEKSFYKFGYKLELDSKQEFNYYHPFDRLHFFWWLRYLLLRYTIIPDGNFFITWEVLRCILGMFVIAINLTHYPGSCDPCIWVYIRISFAAFACLDIYLRFHVCFYNKMGVLVVHPLKTAMHYCTHSLIIDILSTLPSNIFFSAERRQQNLLYVIIKLLGLLQLYRVMALCNYFYRKKLHSNNVFPIVIKYAMYYLTIGIGCASLFTTLICRFDDEIKGDDNFSNGVTCRNPSWLTLTPFRKPITPIRAQLYAIYAVISLITNQSPGTFTITAPYGVFNATVLGIIGFLVNIHAAGNVIAIHSAWEYSLLTHKDHLQAVQDYMKLFKVNRYIQADVLSHFILQWNVKRARNVLDLLKHCPHTLKQDVMYELYGTIVEFSTPFMKGNRPFVRELLLLVTHKVFRQGSFIKVVNDVNSNIYIVVKGLASIIAPDGSTLTKLTAGGIFGNLDNVKWTRQTISVLAADHLECLVVESIHFHNLLINFPLVKSQFMYLTAFHIDYLKGAPIKINEVVKSSSVSYKERLPLPIQECLDKVFLHSSKCLKIGHFLVLFLVNYLEVCFYLYQSVLWEYSIPCIVLQYLGDLLYIIDYYVERHTSFEDPYGNIITDLKAIRRNCHASKWDYVLKLVSLVPADLICWCFTGNVFIATYTVLRFNRVLRLYYIFKYFRSQFQKLDVNFYLNRFGVLTLVTILILHVCTCIFIILHCLDENSMYPELKCNSKMSALTKLKLYIKWSDSTINIFIASPSTNFFPHSVPLIIYCIFLMIFMHMFNTLFLAQVYSIIMKSFYNNISYTIDLIKTQATIKQSHGSLTLFNKATRFLKLIWIRRSHSTFPTFLDEAPYRLRGMVLNSAFAHFIDDHYIFQRCHPDLKRQVVACFRNYTFFEDDLIVYKGSFDENMYFVFQGTVISLDEDGEGREIEIGKLTSTMSFGVIQGLYSGKAHQYSFKCLNTVILLCLKRSAWIHLLRFFPASRAEIRNRLKEYKQVFA